MKGRLPEENKREEERSQRMYVCSTLAGVTRYMLKCGLVLPH